MLGRCAAVIVSRPLGNRAVQNICEGEKRKPTLGNRPSSQTKGIARWIAGGIAEVQPKYIVGCDADISSVFTFLADEPFLKHIQTLY